MSEICCLCFLKPANTYCIPCTSIFCEDCVDTHINLYDIKHNILNYQIFLEQNLEKIRAKKRKMKDVAGWLKEKLLESNVEVDKNYQFALESLKEKQTYLEELVDEIFNAKLTENLQSIQSGRRTLEMMATNDASSAISSKYSLGDLNNVVISEIVCPLLPNALESSLQKELSYNLEIYPGGKPVPLYSFKSNSSQVYLFDLLTEEEVVMTIKNFDCKSFAGWCIANTNIIYTGGWKEGYSSYETFEINTSKWIVEPKPNLLRQRHQHSAIFITDTVYVFSGASTNGLTKSCEKWNIHSEQWVSIADMSEGKAQMGICAVKTNIYLASDRGIERYDTIADSFKSLPVKFENRLLSVLVGCEDYLLIFRGGEVVKLECEHTQLNYKVAQIDSVELWSTTHPILKMNKVYFMLDNVRVVYCYNVIEKTIEIVTNLNHNYDEIEFSQFD